MVCCYSISRTFSLYGVLFRLMMIQCVNGDHNRVFGISLEKQFLKGKENVCSPLVKCVNYIDAKSIDKEKIFQIKGQISTLNSLREQFDQGVDVNLADVDDA